MLNSPNPPSHPLQARNPQQPQADLEGVGAEASEGPAGGAGGLGHGQLVVNTAGPQGQEGRHGLYPRPQRGASECVARRPLPKAEADGSQIRNLGPLRGTLYI